MKFRICLLILFAINVSSGAFAAATFDRSIPVRGPVQIDVRSDPGGVEIRAGGDGSTVRVHAIIKPLAGKLDFGLTQANISELQKNPPIEQNAAHLRIGYARPELLHGVSIHFELEVPRETIVRAQTHSGAITIDSIAGPVWAETNSGQTHISDVAGEVRVTSQSGAIRLRSIGGHVAARSSSGGLQILSTRGPVELETSSGRTEVSDVSGELRATTRSGSILVDNVKGAVTATNSSGSIDAFQLAGSVEVRTHSGAIRISQMTPAPIRALTESGAITVDLANGQGYLIDAQSHSGKVSGPSHARLDSLADLHRLKGQVGDGGPLVDLDSRSSKIEIH